jgi:hypothetical protein
LKTKPEDIKNPDYLKIYEKLKNLEYPCTIVVYGAERTHQTTYRGPHDGAFAIDVCLDVDEAWNLVDCGWKGYPPDLKIYVIDGANVQQLRI